MFWTWTHPLECPTALVNTTWWCQTIKPRQWQNGESFVLYLLLLICKLIFLQFACTEPVQCWSIEIITHFYDQPTLVHCSKQKHNKKFQDLIKWPKSATWLASQIQLKFLSPLHLTLMILPKEMMQVVQLDVWHLTTPKLTLSSLTSINLPPNQKSGHRLPDDPDSINSHFWFQIRLACCSGLWLMTSEFAAHTYITCF